MGAIATRSLRGSWGSHPIAEPAWIGKAAEWTKPSPTHTTLCPRATLEVKTDGRRPGSTVVNPPQRMPEPQQIFLHGAGIRVKSP